MCHGWRSLSLVLLRHLRHTSRWYLTILCAECPLTHWQFQHPPLLHLAQSAQKIAAGHLPLAPTMPCHQFLAHEAAHFCRFSCMSLYAWDSHCCWSTSLTWLDAVGTLSDNGRFVWHYTILSCAWLAFCALQRWMATIAALYCSNPQAFAALMPLRRALIRIVSEADDVALGRSCYAAHFAFCSVLANTL